jgi:hypothetical protein
MGTLSKVGIIFTYSNTQPAGTHSFTNINNVLAFDSEPFILNKLELAFKDDYKLCVVIVMSSRLSVDDVLDNPNLSDRLSSVIESIMDVPCQITLHLLHNGGHMLRLARFGQYLREQVNKTEFLVGSTVIATME